MYRISERFLIVLTIDNVQKNADSLNKIFEILWKNSLINANVLIQDQLRFWTLYTFMPYQTDCFNLTAIKFESFAPFNYSDDSTVQKNQLFPEKLNDFNQCPVTAASSYQDPFVSRPINVDADTQYKGIEIDIVNQICKSLNSILIHSNLSDGEHGTIFSNKTLTGNIKLVLASAVKFSTSFCVRLDFHPTISLCLFSDGRRKGRNNAWWISFSRRGSQSIVCNFSVFASLYWL